jgi:quercetin dioxygenase-like cupin family protein
MKLFRSADAAPVPTDATSFAGKVRSRRLADDATAIPIHVYNVEFDVAARTHWHTHSGAQWLFVIDGRVRVQKWGEPADDLNVGDAVMIERGEKHWHGAAPGSRGAHLAVNLDATTEWLEPVSDDQYGAQIS